MNQLLPAFKRKQQQQKIEMYGWTPADIKATYKENLETIKIYLEKNYPRYEIMAFGNPPATSTILGMVSLTPIQRSDEWIYLDSSDGGITTPRGRRGPRLIVELQYK